MPLNINSKSPQQKLNSKNKPPRYLYHITSGDNWKKIQESQCLQAQDECIGKGIFFFDINNFLKNWTKEEPVGSLNSFAKFLLSYASSKDAESNDLVLLRANTRNFLTKIKLRNEECFKNTMPEVQDTPLLNEYIEARRENNYEDLRSKVNKKDYPNFWEILNGKNPKEVDKKYKFKNPIEYISTEDVPLSEITQVGKASLDEIEDIINNEETKKPIFDLFKRFFKEFKNLK